MATMEKKPRRVRELALVKAVTTSHNRKLGDASTTHAAQVSCPSDCVFKGAGCYAERGPLGFFHLVHLNDSAESLGATALDVAHAEAAAIDAMATVLGRPLRLHTVGDCASDEAAQIVSAAAERYTERGGGPVWTYTHAWRVVSRKSWGKVSVLASCETAADVTAAKRRGYATSIVVEKFDHPRLQKHGRVKVLPCPSQTKHGTTCSDCRLCFNDEGLKTRGYSIAFEIHGDPKSKSLANLALGRRKEKR